MMGVKKMIAILLALCLSLGGLTALAEEADGAAAASGDTLVVGATTMMSGNFFSEMFGNNTADLDVRTLLHDYNLMQWQNNLGAYGMNPLVVSGLVVQEDAEGNRTYTVSIYSDLKFSDGSPITAYDYAFSMLVSMAPQMREIGAQTVYSDYVIGSNAYATGRSDHFAGVRVLNDTTLSVKVVADYVRFFYELALLDYYPYPMSVIAPGCEVADSPNGVYIRNIDQTITEPLFTAELLRETVLDPEKGYLTHPGVVSGAYTLENYDVETHVAEFAINPYYKGNYKGLRPLIPKIIFRHVAPENMIAALESGEIDLLNKCTAADVIDAGLALTGSGPFEEIDYPRSGYSFISFSCEKPITGSDAVRKAIAHCLDKDEVVHAYVRDYGVAIDGYYGIGQWVYQLVMGDEEPPVTALTEDENHEETQITYEEAMVAWDALNLDGLHIYELDVDEAIRLLESDGWTLNREGQPFDPETDDVRCKRMGGTVTPLELKMIYPEGNAIEDSLEEHFLRYLTQAGVKLNVEPMPMTELLDVYYRNVARDADLIYLATNFATVFDPSYTYNPADAYQGSSNRSGLADDELYQLAVNLRLTEPGDVLSYCRKWVAFQERWTEVLPTIPMYSNEYYDFFTSRLKDYALEAGMTWSDAIVGAYLSDEAEEPVEEAETEAAEAEETAEPETETVTIVD